MTRLGFGKIACIVAVFCVATAVASPAQTFTTLASFNGADGEAPVGLIQGFDGNFYGTTNLGGAYQEGTVFQVSPSGNLNSLHSFCSQLNCTDGSGPFGAALVQATNGNFFGTTGGGGSSHDGTLFEINAAGNFTLLYSFAGFPTDGTLPKPMVHARDGNYYGVTSQGGANCGNVGCGTFFRFIPGGIPTVLHSFCAPPQCPDGSFPMGLVQAANGSFYGTTLESSDSSQSCGTVFEITPAGELTTLHTFHHSDGCTPGWPLIQGSDGTFYGTTSDGGNHGGGAVFRMNAQGTLTGFYSFCSEANCNDGFLPNGPLIQATDGNLYGTTSEGGGGIKAWGTIFQITPSGKLTTLYDFCSQTACVDGGFPTGNLVQATDGNLYGTTYNGGAEGDGAIYRLSLGLNPFVRLTKDSGKVGQTGGILGQGFTGTTGVAFNGTPARFTVVSDTFIEATVPQGAASGYVTVNTPTGILTSNLIFHVGP